MRHSHYRLPRFPLQQAIEIANSDHPAWYLADLYGVPIDTVWRIRGRHGIYWELDDYL